MKNNLYKLLETAVIDEKVGIAVIHISGNDDVSVYAASIEKGRKITPHYHSKGSEVYTIISGSGKMKLGKNIGGKVTWQNEFEIEAGDCFTVNEGIVHQLINTGDDKIIALFSCSKVHLGSDRHIVSEEL